MITARARMRSLLVAVATGAGLVGCTTSAATHASGADATTRSPALAAELTRPSQETTVLDAPPGPGSAIAVSSLLFRRAPVVIEAAAGDAASMATAAAIAPRLGAPVLPAAQQEQAAVGRELKRLAPHAILAVGAEAQRLVRSSRTAVPVYDVQPADSPTLPADLPTVRAPKHLAVTVLVDVTRDDAAATATAHAVGATVVPVHGADPRADAAAIEALHRTPPRVVVAVGGAFGPADRLRTRLAVAATGTQLPGGGQTMLPGRRLVCLYGHPGTRALGVLGEQDLGASIDRARQTAKAYEPLSDVPVVPGFEIIATVAEGGPGPDGDFSSESTVESLRPWVEQAGAAGLYVVLDLQPGRADLTAQAQRYEPLLLMPHVGLAVDPEWKLGPDQVPLKQIGGIDAAEVNRTEAWLADLTAQHALPQKLFVIHQFRLSMIRDEPALDTTHDELAVLIHMDGQGSTGQKDATWHSVVTARPTDLPLGWKNFYDEDHPMLTPEQTMSRRPAPVMITYQ
ncbi:hypothetical protein [Actinophytocola sp.]|uniref:hypothetical protein n=1 Tax=Actinophytocola sp. TaxID=1872138 RepID=UPI00389AB478